MKLPRIFSRSDDTPEASRDRQYLWIGLTACAVVLGLSVFRGTGKPGTVAKADRGAEHSVLSSAVDIKENDAQYTITIAMAARDASQMNLRMEGDRLHFVSGAKGGAQYDQSFSLPKAAIGGKITVNRQKDRLVLNVPKANGSTSQNAVASAPQPATANDPMLQQIAHMQRQMKAMMQAAQGTGTDPFSGVGSLSAGLNGGGMMNLEEKSDQYLIHLQIPKEEQKNVKVAVDNDRVLKITATQESSSGGSFSTSNYSQVFTLPGPVQSDKITMSPEGDSLLITLPKA